ncbi:hypothetical protein OK016_13890 [Vibrio chagasii]|nr:hypothetical protein [Vibrio chagasii]
MRFARLNEKSTRAITQQTTYVQMMPHTRQQLTWSVLWTAWPRDSHQQCMYFREPASLVTMKITKHGYQTVMVAGGGEELMLQLSLSLHTLFATSLKNDTPKKSPSPYDSERDGLVIGEGAGTPDLVEEY